jgi:5'-nucleotidase
LTKKILVTNDDGIASEGLHALIDSLAGLGDITAVCPEGQVSNCALQMTIHKPMRLVLARESPNCKVYSLSGTASDCITVGLIHLLGGQADLVVSGMNLGLNLTLQTIMTSGTLGGALRGALCEIPSIALAVEPDVSTYPCTAPAERLTKAGEMARYICGWMLEHRLPAGVDLLNVNFPPELGPCTPVRITVPARHPRPNSVREMRDPGGHPIYWIWGNPIGEIPAGTDYYAVYNEGAVSISPLALSLCPASDADTDGLRGLVHGIQARLTV